MVLIRTIFCKKSDRGGKTVSVALCGWRDSNSHRKTPTTPSKWRVYHFATSALFWTAKIDKISNKQTFYQKKLPIIQLWSSRPSLRTP